MILLKEFVVFYTVVVFYMFGGSSLIMNNFTQLYDVILFENNKFL